MNNNDKNLRLPIDDDTNKFPGWEPMYFPSQELEVLIRYHKEKYPGLEELKIIKQGDWIDLRAAEDVNLKAFDFKLISLGVSMKLPKGFTAIMVPRSSTFKNFGIIQTNSIGVIDESYCGDEDIWRFPALAIRDTEIHKNDRIAQFTIIQKANIKLTEVEKLLDDNRGAHGSTGIK